MISVLVHTILLKCLLCQTLLSHISQGFICHTMARHLGMRVGSGSDRQVSSQLVASYRFKVLFLSPDTLFHQCTGMLISFTNTFSVHL